MFASMMKGSPISYSSDISLKSFSDCQRNGADFSVFINTAQEFDGSDAGARPDEAISWGKIRKTASPVKASSMKIRASNLILA